MFFQKYITLFKKKSIGFVDFLVEIYLDSKLPIRGELLKEISTMIKNPINQLLIRFEDSFLSTMREI